MSHSAKAVILHCMDFRFVHAIVHFLKDEGYRDAYDDVSVAGAVKNLVDPYDPADTEFVYRQIEIARKLHGAREVILINHMDCGAYGGRADFTTVGEERARHTKDLLRAKEMVEHRFAEEGIRAIPILADLSEKGEVTFAKLA